MKRIQNKNQMTIRRRTGYILSCTTVALFLLFSPGCGNKFFDPTQIGRFRPVPSVNVILDTLGVSEEAPVAWEQAEDPKPADTVIKESDYVLRSGDIVRISIFELLQEGESFDKDYIVTETGKISIPEVGIVEAAGLTETQLEDEIRRVLSPSVLKEPSVVATLINSSQRTFSIIGDGIPAPGRYLIPRYGFKLTDALATAGGPRQFNVSYIYVSRYVGEKETGELELPELFKEPELKQEEPGELELLEPQITSPRVTRPRTAEPQIPGRETEITLPEITEPEVTEPEISVPETLEPQISVPEETVEPELKIPEIITPRAQRQWPQSRVVITSSEMITERELAQTTFPQGFERLGNNGRRNLGNGGSTATSSMEQVTPEPTEEAIQGEPVSVRDILKGLSERARREQTTITRTPPTDLTASTEKPSPLAEEPSTEPSTMEVTEKSLEPEPISVEDVRTPPQASPRTRTNGQPRLNAGVTNPSTVATPTARPRVAEEPKTNDILRKLSERRRPEAEAIEEPTPREDVTGSSSGQTLPQIPDEEINVDEILKSLSQQRRATKAERVEELVKPEEEEIIKSEEIVRPEEPVAPPKVKERIDVDEILKLLEEKPGQEKAKKPIEQPTGIVGPPETPAEPVIPEVTGEEIVAPEPTPLLVAPGEKAVEEAKRIEWIFQEGKWVPVQVGPPEAVEPIIKFEPNEEQIVPLEGKPVLPEVEWAEAAKTKLLKIPSDKLLAGDPKYNVVIKPGDTVFVPVDVIGEFCIMGNVNSQGYINLTGRPMTLKMAIAAAGGLGPLAWPKKCEVVRRIGKKKEEIVLVDLDKIASGEQPDFFIKPNDLVNVGTHATSIWRAVLRNSFRATYGFGFIYDRNFADVDFYTRGTAWF